MYVEVGELILEKIPAPPDQVTELAAPPKLPFNVTIPPLQDERFEPVLTVATGFIATTVEPCAEVHPETVTVKLYVPAFAAVVLAIEGFCNELENEFGPVHAYVAPTTAGCVKFKVEPIQIALFELGIGVVGIAFTTTAVDVAELEHPFTVAVTK